jgi:REP element-mobilizing transposase RayT
MKDSIDQKMHLANHYYHVYNRGCNREHIFANDDNYRFLLQRAKSFLPDYPMRIIAYCLMPNHYHFLLYPLEDRILSRFIQRLFNSYTQAFNKQQERSGTLFEGRAKSTLVNNDEYLLHICRYIHLNPVQAGLVKHPGDWPYSNYLEFVCQRNGSLVDHAFVRQQFPSSNDYEDFVMSEISASLEQKLQVYYLDFS